MSDLSWVPQSCTLPTEEQPLRVAEWDALFTGRLQELSRPQQLHASWRAPWCASSAWP
ncbi:hypothetical protein OIU91_02480 [Streptomyces sp. NBC_01456]|uniref:hypothetical protein n=1 Tax=unclassified Streptomyces TaxID=2593676 RepID=UPI002E334A1D|nr:MULTISPECIES: hypothetical protein [unclassified Streptomyces]